MPANRPRPVTTETNSTEPTLLGHCPSQFSLNNIHTYLEAAVISGCMSYEQFYNFLDQVHDWQTAFDSEDLLSYAYKHTAMYIVPWLCIKRSALYYKYLCIS